MRTVEIQTPFGKDIAFTKLRGYEGLSQLYEYNIILTSKNPNLDGTQIIGQTATVNIDTKSGNRPLNGLVTDFGYLSEDEDEQGYHLYSCVMRPSMWYMDQRYDSRVFVDKTIIDIMNIVIGEFGIPYNIKCQNSYRTYGHSIQYQETSFAYLNRLFEQEGIYYYFEHSAGSNTLVIVDDVASHTPIQGKSTLPYHSIQTAPGTPDQAYIDHWQQTDRLATKTVNINDHNYQTAKTKLSASGPTHNLGGMSTEHYDFYSNFKDSAEAQHYKEMRAQAYNAQSKHIDAAGNTLTIAPGYTFSLVRHPHSAANTEHLVLYAEYDFQEAGYTSGSDPSHYRIAFTAIPTSYQYRQPKNTPKPQIVGTQGAIVTGPAGEEVYTNEYGDIKVQFHWDRYGPSNEKSSDWIRVAQGSAGGSFGSINTPRIDEEVLIDFINGDTDRPIVIGRLYNSANPPPWGFPAAAKQSGIKSKSFNSPLENFNELMFNDDAGSEKVNFQAQKDLISLVKNDETRTVNRDRTTTIDNDETITVKGKRTETVIGTETIDITGDRTETLAANETITISGSRTETVTGTETISITGDRTKTLSANETVNITGDRTESVTGNETVNVTGAQNVTVTQAKSETVHQGRTITVSKDQTNGITLNHTHNVGQNLNQSVGQSYTLGAKAMTATIGTTCVFNVADQFVISVGAASLTLNSSGEITLSGSIINIDASTNVHTTAPDVNIN